MKRNINTILFCALLGWLSAGIRPALAMDRWSALSLIESGNNDGAIGQAGEVSRFQIKPMLWEKYCHPYPVTAKTNPQAALYTAQAIMSRRCQEFTSHFHRPPTDFEYYVLWNAPAQIRKPSKVVTERATRFRNLVSS